MSLFYTRCQTQNHEFINVTVSIFPARNEGQLYAVSRPVELAVLNQPQSKTKKTPDSAGANKAALCHPDGIQVLKSHPKILYSLVFGSGHKPPDGASRSPATQGLCRRQWLQPLHRGSLSHHS